MVDVIEGTEAQWRAHIEGTRWSDHPNKRNSLSALVHRAPTAELRDLAYRYQMQVLDEEHVIADFPWPCALRTAHEAHRPTRATLTERQIAEHGGDCPGVKAHPLTMIGRAHRGG